MLTLTDEGIEPYNIKSSAISRKRSFKMLIIVMMIMIVIAMIIVMVRNLMPESFMVMLRDLML